MIVRDHCLKPHYTDFKNENNLWKSKSILKINAFSYKENQILLPCSHNSITCAPHKAQEKPLNLEYSEPPTCWRQTWVWSRSTWMALIDVLYLQSSWFSRSKKGIKDLYLWPIKPQWAITSHLAEWLLPKRWKITAVLWRKGKPCVLLMKM